MSPIESALMVLVPEAERLVKPFRDRYDPSAAAGIPAHITLLYPLSIPMKLIRRCLTSLTSASADGPRFGFLSHRSGDSPTPFCILPQSRMNRFVN